MSILHINLLTKANCAEERFIFKGEKHCPFKDHVLYSIFVHKDYVAIQQDQIYALIDARSQLVLPASAASWIVSTVRNGFWKKPNEGGLPKDKHFAEAEFNGERLKIRRTMNADVEGEMGFTITNLSRSQSLVDTDKQYGIYTDQLLVDFIFPVLELHD